MSSSKKWRALVGFLIVLLAVMWGNGQTPPTAPDLQTLRDTNVVLRMSGFFFPGGVDKNGHLTGEGTQIVLKNWQGSGFIVQSDGTLVTNYHVASKALAGVAVFDDGSRFDVDQIKIYDPVNDLAVLRIRAQKQFPTVVLGNSETVNPLDEVIAVGNPEGMGLNMTKGQVSQVVKDDHGKPALIRHTAQIAPGSSGGSLNRGNEVVGVNVSVRLYSAFGTPTGFNDAIPINKVKRLLEPQTSNPYALQDVFNPKLEYLINNKKLQQVYARSGQVDAARKKEPGVAAFEGAVLDPLEDYLFLLQAEPGKTLQLALYNRRQQPLACGAMNTDIQPILYSNDDRQEVIVAILNLSNKVQNFGVTVFKILW